MPQICEFIERHTLYVEVDDPVRQRTIVVPYYNCLLEQYCIDCPFSARFCLYKQAAELAEKILAAMGDY